ncbi:MAG: DinB family protein [Flavobacteriaceae bacterium]
MEKIFDIIAKNRAILFKILTETPREELLKIPQGFNNNIWWNIAHVVVTEQLLAYKMSGLPMNIEDALVDKFRKDTTPDGTATEEEIKKIETLLASLPKQTKTDYENGFFKVFKEYTTTPNVTLQSVEDALAFNVFHEGSHLGSILALKRAITN